MASCVLASHKSVYTSANIPSVQGRVSRSDAFTLDSHISILLPELVEESQNDIDAAKDAWIASLHVVYFILAVDFGCFFREVLLRVEDFRPKAA